MKKTAIIYTFIVIITLNLTGCMMIPDTNHARISFDEDQYLQSITNLYDSNSNSYYDPVKPNLSDSLYFTYYSAAFIKEVDPTYFIKCSQKIEKWFAKIEGKDILDLNPFDVLDSIYYYFQIAKLLDLDIREDDKTKLLDMIIDSQVPAGYFNLYVETKIDNVTSDPFIKISTLHMMELLDTFSVKPKYSYDKWIKLLEDKVLSSDTFESFIADASVYIQICQLVGEEVPQVLRTQLKSWLDRLDYNFLISLDLAALDEIYSVLYRMGENSNSELIKDNIINIVSNKNSYIYEDFHIVNYYTASLYFKEIEVPNELKEKVIDVAQRQNIMGFFTNDAQNILNISASYHANKIFNLFNQESSFKLLKESELKRYKTASAIEKILLMSLHNKSNYVSAELEQWEESLLVQFSKVNFEGKDNFNNLVIATKLLDSIKTKAEFQSSLIKKFVIPAEESLKLPAQQEDLLSIIEKCIYLRFLENSENEGSLISELEGRIVHSTLELYKKQTNIENMILLNWVGDTLSSFSLELLIRNEELNEYIVNEYSTQENNGMFSVIEGTQNSLEYQYMIINLLKDYDCIM